MGAWKNQKWQDIIPAGYPVPAVAPSTYNPDSTIYPVELTFVVAPALNGTFATCLGSGSYYSGEFTDRNVSGANPNVGVLFYSVSADLDIPPYTDSGGGAASVTPGEALRLTSAIYWRHKPQQATAHRYMALRDLCGWASAPPIAAGVAAGPLTTASAATPVAPRVFRAPLGGVGLLDMRNDTFEVGSLQNVSASYNGVSTGVRAILTMRGVALDRGTTDMLASAMREGDAGAYAQTIGRLVRFAAIGTAPIP